ncbi:MAG: YmdB family metallophosphoesterase [Solirubrobacterales bacterium]|nr:YmdB family metallophosphoesterase [Solirubrobacterales bacterium]HMT04356.1 TIGR00282 family metallophosphoesterase [Solirubrobacterales bacterium]
MKLLFIGDVVGSPGRKGLAAVMPRLRQQHSPDLVVVNGENSAGGLGITEKTAGDIFNCGADVITLGNHSYRQRESWDYLDRADNVVRPANYRRANPGRGHCVIEVNPADGSGPRRVAVINLIGKIGLDAARSPFDEADLILGELERNGGADTVIVDFHAEVTSEKVAMGWWLDGRVAAVLGTHTHVPTADGRVLPGGTAFISDVGMTGARESVLGVKKEQAIEKMRTDMPVRFETATGDVWVMGALVGIGESGLATSFDQILVPVAGEGSPEDP